MKIETGKIFGKQGWFIFVDGKLDANIPEQGTELFAAIRAEEAYPMKRIITSENRDHYFNRQSVEITKTKNTLIESYIQEAKDLLSEAYGFKSTSPHAQRNINAAMDLLDDVLHQVNE